MGRLSYKDNPEAVIDKLLEYHSIEELRAILNKKARRKSPKKNRRLNIAIETYLLQRQHDSNLYWAEDEIAGKYGLAPKSVQNYRQVFRDLLKQHYTKLQRERGYNLPKSMDFERFFKGYIKYLAETKKPNPVKNEEDFEESYRAYIHRYIKPDNIF